ncbi:MAG: hypothetical protein M3P70_00250 [Actinomycetota bacterium]|nr:hypothetical protein [Actinomycetota bacterium]
MWKGSVGKEVVTVCYSHRDRKLEEEARAMARERDERRRREERVKQSARERDAKRDRELVKA